MATGSARESANEDGSPSAGAVPPASLLALEPHYRTGAGDLAAGFFSPCLQVATLYRRAAGYFSSTALLTWMEALPRLVQGDDLEVRLIAAPELTSQDKAVLAELVAEEKRAEYRRLVVERMLDEVLALAENPADAGVRARIFAWLVANDRLDIRFAFAKHIEAPGIFHEKMGVFDFTGGVQVAFTGSANETLGGHRRNYESIDVYRTWVAGDAGRVATKVAQFDEAWENEAEGLDVERAERRDGRTAACQGPAHATWRAGGSRRPTGWRTGAGGTRRKRSRSFLEQRSGVLEMATGDWQDPNDVKDPEAPDGCGGIEGGGHRDRRHGSARPVGRRAGWLDVAVQATVAGLPAV